VVIAIPLAVALCIAPLAQAATAPAVPRLVTVSGSGEVRVPPDEIVISLGVETSSLQLMTARSDNDDRINAMKKAAGARGVRPEHLKTDYLSIEPRYRDEHTATGFVGYFVRRTLVVTVRDSAAFESLLSELLQAGATHVHDIQFQTTELRRHRDAARDMAIKAAREKAEAFARQLGQQVGLPQNITESGGWYWTTSGTWGNRWSGVGGQNSMQVARGGGETGNALAPGLISVIGQVTVSFELR
jgi:uncharacterized protein YggE